MQCPEVWKFAPPQSNNKEEKGDYKNFPSKLKDFYYAHLVSVVLPNKKVATNNLFECLSSDCDYYKVKDFSLSEFCRQEFIENFIRKGTLSALSINTKLDTENCVALTPEGVLVLSLNRQSFQELGLEGKVSHFSSRRKEKYIVHIDLKNEQFTKNTKLYERTIECLAKRLEKFTLILSWQPQKKTVCPSSVAKYLAENGINIFLCSPKCVTWSKPNINVPVIEDKEDFMGSEVLEWVGIFSLDCHLQNINEQINQYKVPSNNILVEQVTYLEYRGFFTTKQITKMCNILENYITAPWISICVQGFSDSAVAWKLQENHFYTNSNNGYVLFLQPSAKYLLCTQSTSNKKLKIKNRA